MSRAFDRFMVHVSIGTNRKLRRLPVTQRWVYVAGVLALAAQSPIRGALLIADGESVTPEDVAEEATVPVREARAALVALRKMGMLDRDANGVEWVHDWDALNPDPKPSDSPEAARERKRRQRAKERAERNGHADVTRDTDVTTGVTSRESHAPEEEDTSEDVTPLPPQAGESTPPRRPSGNRKKDIDAWQRSLATWTGEHFPGVAPGLVDSCAQTLRAGRVEPTVEALAPLVAKWTESAA